MTPTELNRILIAVPIGRENAEGHKAIWERVDQDAPRTVQFKLAQMCDAGLIQRRGMKTPTGFRWIYWRDTTRPVAGLSTPSTVLGAG